MDFIGEEEKWVDQSKKRKAGARPSINKKNKLTLVFDPEARKRFLTGFRKRKQERKEKYQEKLERELAQEKVRSREEAKTTVAKKQSSSHSVLPEVEHLLESSSEDEDSSFPAPSTFSIGHTTVSISSMLGPRLFPTSLETLKKEEAAKYPPEEESEEEDEGTPLLKYGIPYNPDEDEEKYRPGPLKGTGTTPLTPEEKDALKLKQLRSVLKNPNAAAAKMRTETEVRKEAHRILQHSDIYKKTLRIKQQKSKKFKLNRLQPQGEEVKGQKNKSSKVAAAKVKVKSRGRVTK